MDICSTNWLSMVDLQHMIAFTFCIWSSILNSFMNEQYGRIRSFALVLID